MRLFRSKFVWALVIAVLAVGFIDEAATTVGDAECGSSVVLLTSISLLDVWAGVSSFSEGFSAQSNVAVAEHAWIEKAPAAVHVLQAVLHAAWWCGDFYSYIWREWKFRHDLVVVAGPSCCPFSVSGKRLRQWDPRSSQGMDTALLAVSLGALVLIMENVVNFLDEVHLHHLCADIDAYLLASGMVAIGTWRLMDSKLGGASGRERVFLRWEKEEMASCLPPVRAPPCDIPRSSVSDFLDPVDVVSNLAITGQSKFEEFEVFELSDTRATQVDCL